jgi:tetratricopeptide (TPR) repeat protein
MEDLKDLAAAEATLNDFLGYPGRSPGEVIGALHLLADWQLQANRDSKAARETLQRIVDLYPGTPFAHAAQQRIAHLGSFNEAMRARYSTVFTVTPGKRGDNLHRADAPPPDPRVRVAELVEQLKLYPADTDAREELAVLYAAEFQRLDLAVEQLEQLIALPAEPPKHVARWLNLLATLHANYAHDQQAAEKALHRIMERFPGGALAAMAASRLATVQTEIKTAQSTPTKVLGVYDKDLGLKSPGQ